MYKLIKESVICFTEVSTKLTYNFIYPPDTLIHEIDEYYESVPWIISWTIKKNKTIHLKLLN